MKKLKRVLAVMLAIAMMLATDYMPVLAESVSGKTEDTAIQLKLGKKKTSKFWTGSSSSIYYAVTLPDQGTLSVNVTAESLGTGVTVKIRKVGVGNWSESKSFSYNKKKKITSGTIKSEYILTKGNYIVEVAPGKIISKDKKISVTAKFTSGKFVDKEPNNKEEDAQEIRVYNNAPSYKMYLTSMSFFEDQDLTDCVKFNLKDTETVSISLTSKAKMSNVKILVREKTSDGYNTIKAYDVVNGKLSEKLSLKKGTYYIKVWCADDGLKVQMPYTIQCKA